MFKNNKKLFKITYKFTTIESPESPYYTIVTAKNVYKAIAYFRKSHHAGIWDILNIEEYTP